MNMFGSTLAEAWPQNETVASTSASADSTGSAAPQTVAINPDKHETGQWKQFQPQPNVNHLGELFEEGENDTSLSGLSSVSEQTRKFKLFTNTPNTYTNNRLNALATSLQGRDDDESGSDIVGNLMDKGENVLSKIRKASNLDMRAEYDTSLDDLKHIDERSNGSTLSSLSENITHSTQLPPQPQTVRFKSPEKLMQSSGQSTKAGLDSVADLGINESLNLEQKPSMSFVREDARITSSSDISMRQPVRRDVYPRRDSALSSRQGSTRSPSGDPRLSTTPELLHPQTFGTVRRRPSSKAGPAAVEPAVAKLASSAPILPPAAQANSSVDKVFDFSVAVNSVPLRDLSLPHVPEDTSIARKNVSFSGSLANMVHQITDVGATEIDLGGLHLDCLRGLEDLLPNLERADLSKNNLRVVDGLSPSCLEVDLSFNELNRISTFPLSFITTLNLQHNYLEDLSGLKQLRALTHLDVSFNKLTSLKGIKSLLSLHTLNVSNNELKTLEIAHPKLLHIKACHNSIKAASLETPVLETLILDDNELISLEAVPSVKTLSVENNKTKLKIQGWASAEEIHCEYAGDMNTIVLSCKSMDSVANCAILSLSSTQALLSLRSAMHPIQQLDLVGLDLRSIPSWLPQKLPNLQCLNLAFNQLDENCFNILSKCNLKTLSLFGNRVRSLPQLPVGALDLRGNPVTEKLYPDMKTFLQGLVGTSDSPVQQYNALLQVDWTTVMTSWRNEEKVSAEFDEYYRKLRPLKLWWLDGAPVGSPHRLFTHPRGHGIGALAAVDGAMGNAANSTIISNNISIASVGVEPVPESESSVIHDKTQEFDMRHQFLTPSANNWTPSRVNGSIETIGKAKAAAFHSTPAPASVRAPATEELSTPQTTQPKTKYRPLGKDMQRARRTPNLSAWSSVQGPSLRADSRPSQREPATANFGSLRFDNKTDQREVDPKEEVHKPRTPGYTQEAIDNDASLILALCARAYYKR